MYICRICMRGAARVCIRSGNTARWQAHALQRKRYILTRYSWITVYTVKSRYVPVVLWTLLEIVASALLMSAWYFVGIRLMKRIVHETLSFEPFFKPIRFWIVFVFMERYICSGSESFEKMARYFHIKLFSFSIETVIITIYTICMCRDEYFVLIFL